MQIPDSLETTTMYPKTFGTAKTVQTQNTLNGETVIPGFTCRVDDIFS